MAIATTYICDFTGHRSEDPSEFLYVQTFPVSTPDNSYRPTPAPSTKIISTIEAARIGLPVPPVPVDTVRAENAVQ